MLGALIVRLQVGYIGACKLEQTEVLAGARESSSLVVGSPHVAAAEGRLRTRPRLRLGDFGVHLEISMLERGMRDRIVVQTGDVPELHRQVGAGLAVGRKEGAAFRGVLIDRHRYVECSVDVRDRGRELYVPGFERAANHLKAVRVRESDQGVVVLLARSKPLGKLLWGNVLLVGGAGRIVELLQEIFQLWLVAQRQNYIEMHGLICGKLADEFGLSVEDRFAHMTSQQGLGRRLANQIHSQQHREEHEQGHT